MSKEKCLNLGEALEPRKVLGSRRSACTVSKRGACIQEKRLDLGEVLGPKNGAWIQEKCLDLGEVIGSRRCVWV
jgi:hypothetical protein